MVNVLKFFRLIIDLVSRNVGKDVVFGLEEPKGETRTLSVEKWKIAGSNPHPRISNVL